MRRTLWIILFIVTSALTTSAQNIRLGERVPKFSVTGESAIILETSSKPYHFLILTHSESEYCNRAIATLTPVLSGMAEHMEVLLLTNESSDEQEEIHRRIGLNYPIVFDVNNQTFKAIGVTYVPFGVIYETKRRRALWIGSLHQLDEATLNEIITK